MDMTWLVGSLILGFALWRAARAEARRRAARLKGRLATTAMGRMAGPLPAPAAVLAGMGGGTARSSADEQVLVTTTGLRAIAVIVGGGILWLLVAGADTGLVPSPAFGWAMAGAVVLSVMGTLVFEARWGHDRLVVTHFVHWRREFVWADLQSIADDNAYTYILRFRGGRRARLPKHLAGIDALLDHIGETLEKNARRDARASRG